ncbi:MAG: TRAP transporter small permease [Oscillibacter sp.]|jgi:TRAP-type C4-dicarboxylate transport system permease small subunit|nr:TRAP transporter small permease [Oscillibacter sp.]
MTKVFNGLRKVVKVLIIALFSAVILVTFAQVIARYVLNNSIIWAEEFSRYFFEWVIMLACALAVGSNSHMRIDVIFRVLPKKVHKSYMMVIDGLVLVFFVLMIFQSIRLVMTAQGQLSSAMQIPMSVVYLGLPVGFTLMLLFGIERIVRDIHANANCIDEQIFGNIPGEPGADQQRGDER